MLQYKFIVLEQNYILVVIAFTSELGFPKEICTLMHFQNEYRQLLFLFYSFLIYQQLSQFSSFHPLNTITIPLPLT